MSEQCPRCQSLSEELDKHHTWDGMMELLDKHYPPSVFTGESGDPGARIIVLARALDKANARIAELERDRAEALGQAMSWHEYGYYSEGLSLYRKVIPFLRPKDTAS